jgi:flagellar basal body-associated protein FliL
MMRKSTIRILFAGAAAAALLAGCGAKDKAPSVHPQEAPAVAHSGGQASGGADAQPQTQPQAQAQAPQNHTAAIQTYFGNENGTALVAKQTTITYASDNDKYVAALNAMKQSGDSKAVSLFDGFTFKSAVLEQGKLKLDLKLDEQGKLGSSAEELTLQALQKTLFQFPEVKEIYVTVDGSKVDSLMGHMDLPYPIKRG